jgi:hypothetical protein
LRDNLTKEKMEKRKATPMMELKLNRSVERKMRNVVAKAKEDGWLVSREPRKVTMVSPAGDKPPLVSSHWPTKRKLKSLLKEMEAQGFILKNNNPTEKEED